ncbi:MAG TPA: alpha/beta fold hydrolase [Rudaea sp.]|jgi:pimeloyl-ACP methyl ester carboxylesterase|nr:alpha/beta fold hydrolase [Rudaea sp.]
MKLDTRTVLRIAIAVAVVGYLAFTQFAKTHDGDRHAPKLAAPIAANAKAFTLGALAFKTCELAQKHSGATTSAFCAPFSVPENRADANGRKLQLRLALIKSDAAAADSDIVVFLAGGPGQSAVDTWPQVAPAFAPLLAHHHVLLLDQRGTGGSNVLECKGDDADKDESGGAAGFDAARTKQRTRECLDQVSKHADPRFYTTTDAVADLEAVRQALGAPLFDLVGVSYGTRMAQQYAMRHADGVRSIVLDSAVPNESALGQDFAENLDTALKLQFAQCDKTPACKKAFGDPLASLFKLRDSLHDKPMDYSYRDPVTFEAQTKHLNAASLAGLVRMFAYTPETSALLPLSIAEGLKGDFTPLAGQTQMLTGDMADLAENAMQLSVICSEDADLLAPRPQDEGTLLGNHLVNGIKTACEVWPHETRPADFHAPLKTDKPVLILEGAFDPVTPPRYGEQIMKGLSDGRLLIAKGQGHNVIGRGCIPKLVGEFVDKLAPKTLDAKCVDRLGPMLAFVNFNGAAP